MNTSKPPLWAQATAGVLIGAVLGLLFQGGVALVKWLVRIAAEGLG